MKKALIIGCGIAGPAAALFLKRAGLEVIVYEAQSGPDDEAGPFWSLTPNGVHVLKALGVENEVRAHGHALNRIVFQRSDGSSIAAIDNSEASRYGAGSILIRRGLLHRVLREAALQEGILIRYGKTLEAADTDAAQARASFADGTVAEGDLMIGCDGLHSQVRRSLFPAALTPSYLGLMTTGGMTRLPDLAATPTLYMIYGRRAFFGYQVISTGKVYWFSTFGVEEQDRGAFESDAPRHMAWRHRTRHLLRLHEADAALISTIIRATPRPLGAWPAYDLPFLETWTTGRVCLIGAAAHATASSTGQGVSMALEDAIVLAKCLRDRRGVRAAFWAFEDARKKRVEKAIQQMRQENGHKVVSNRIQAWIRNRILPINLKRRSHTSRWIYEYRVDWDEPMKEAL